MLTIKMIIIIPIILTLILTLVIIILIITLLWIYTDKKMIWKMVCSVAMMIPSMGNQAAICTVIMVYIFAQLIICILHWNISLLSKGRCIYWLPPLEVINDLLTVANVFVYFYSFFCLIDGASCSWSDESNWSNHKKNKIN